MTGGVSAVQSVADLVVDFPVSVISIEALKRASYAMMNRASVIFDVSPDSTICRIQPVTRDEDLIALERDFRREALDQDLRMTIEARTESVRTAILGLAFSRTGLQDG